MILSIQGVESSLTSNWRVSASEGRWLPGPGTLTGWQVEYCFGRLIGIPFVVILLGIPLSKSVYMYTHTYIYMAVGQNLVPLVNIKIAGKWMFIPLKMVLIGIDPYPYIIYIYDVLCVLFISKMARKPAKWGVFTFLRLFLQLSFFPKCPSLIARSDTLDDCCQLNPLLVDGFCVGPCDKQLQPINTNLSIPASHPTHPNLTKQPNQQSVTDLIYQYKPSEPTL